MEKKIVVILKLHLVENSVGKIVIPFSKNLHHSAISPDYHQVMVKESFVCETTEGSRRPATSLHLRKEQKYRLGGFCSLVKRLFDASQKGLRP